MDSDSYHNGIAAHYARVWGAEGVPRQWDRGPREALARGFSVLEFAPRDGRAMWTYATVGLSLPASERPLELHLFAPAADSRHVELLTAIAHYHQTASPLGLGHTVDFGRPWLPGSRCDHGLILRPYLDGPALEWATVGDREVRCCWLMPVTPAEVAFKKAEGLEALEQAFEQASVDYLDPTRASVIPVNPEPMHSDAARLWATPDRARYFLVPDGADLGAGDFTIRLSTGEERHVDAAAVAEHEVTEDEAKAWLKAQLGETLREAKSRVTGWVEGLQAKTTAMRAENDAAWAEGDADTPPGSARQAAERLGAFLHQLAESVRKGAEDEARRSRDQDPDA